MSFRLDKCRWIVSKRGEMITTKGVELPESNIANVQDSYKYFWDPTGTILGCERVNHRKNTDRGFGKSWPKEEIKVTQIKTTKLHNTQKFHPNSSTLRL